MQPSRIPAARGPEKLVLDQFENVIRKPTFPCELLKDEQYSA